MNGKLWRVLILSALPILGMAAGGASSAQERGGAIVLLSLDGVVDPFVASYVHSGIEAAADEGAVAVLITIDTPGGLDSAMRAIVQSVLNADVPVICFVAPEGARAASAGTFILLSCPVAAMAPGTNVGAAHPVGVSGAIELKKAENDAAAYIRSIAERRGRDADWAERAVRESVSVTAEEALDIAIIDHVANDVPSLLRDLDGTTVKLAGGARVEIRTTGMTVQERDMGLGVSLLHTVLDPNLAFIFFYLGIALVAIEFFVPGGVLGVLGGIMLILAVMALGMLPVELLGLILLVASVAFFLLELKLPGTGIATGAGLVTLVLGGLFLFDPSVPTARVSPWVIAPVAAFAAIFFLVVVRAAIRMRGARTVSGTSTVVGAEGTTVTALDPTGVVLVAAEEWTATSDAGPLERGRRVRVTRVDGLRVRVVPADRPVDVAAPGTTEAPMVSSAPEGGKE
ncbi:MAG: nodulation protein NfeD [Actinobacteria bacterium]|nr:nodulation protein NfeD [Actinomycetota bacterium]